MVNLVSTIHHSLAFLNWTISWRDQTQQLNEVMSGNDARVRGGGRQRERGRERGREGGREREGERENH